MPKHKLRKEFPDLAPGAELEYVKASIPLCFLCPKGHNYKKTVGDRRRGSACPYCSGHSFIIEPLPIPAVVQHLTALGVTPQYRFLVLAQI